MPIKEEYKTHKKNPRFTIVTAVLNQAATLHHCLESIIGQTLPDKELIVIDGGSKDGSVDIIKSFQRSIAWWESRLDRGIYHAWNKALKHAKGEWICFLGADDCFYDSFALEKTAPLLSKALAQGCRLAYGQVAKVNAAGNVVQLLGKPWEKISWQIRHGMPIHMPHPGMMHHRSLFEEYGIFDEKFRIAGDYEFLLRELKDPARKAIYLGFPLVKFGIGGISEANRLATIKEARQARLKHGLPPSWLWSLVFLRAATRKFLPQTFQKHLNNLPWQTKI